MGENVMDDGGTDSVLRTRLLTEALARAPHEGWTEALWEDVCAAAAVDPVRACTLFPRKARDLALHFHDDSDRRLRERLAGMNLVQMRVRERIAAGIRTRLEIVRPHREAVRRAVSLFALPSHCAEGASAIWRTADIIWNEAGDRAEDYNWYSKRAILSAIYGATLLYWLDDKSEGEAQSWRFLDRRIEGVMRFEAGKVRLRANPLVRVVLAGPLCALRRIRPPHTRKSGCLRAGADPFPAPGGAIS